LLIVGLSLCGPAFAGDDVPPSGPYVWSGDPAALRCLSICELDNLFRAASIHEMPHGTFPGEVLHFTNVPMPGVIKAVANDRWKGKIIEPDGSFTNMWKKRTALHSCLKWGPSHLDGQPCVVCEYPRLTPLFGPMRDEYREIAPGVLLGRQYRRVPCVRFLGYNVMVRSECGECKTIVLTQEVIPAPQSTTPEK